MRPIKFRAWDKKENKFIDITPMPKEGFIVSEFNLDTVEGDQRILSGKTGKNVFVTMEGSVVSVCPVTDLSTCVNDDSQRYELQQFTGLHDKNGKEIWEGDIVEYGRHGRLWKGEIVFEFGCFGIYEGQFQYDGALVIFHAACEVLGNRFEHPELLR